MYRSILLLGSVLILSFQSQQIQAQERDTLRVNEENDLPAVRIRSTPIIDELQRIPSGINVISAPNLRRGDQTSVANELNKAPGVFMQQGAINTSRITIRGLGARSNYSTNRVKAYFEGIPLTSGEGETVLNDIDLNVIERIEVIKGPTSSIYGSGLGGVINVSAQTPNENDQYVSGQVMGGSYGLIKSGVSTSLSNGTSGMFIGLNQLAQDGFRDNSTYDRQTATLYATTQLSEKSKLNFFGNYTSLKGYIPSSINEEDFQNNPQTAPANWSQSQGYESYDKLLAGISHVYEITDRFRNTTSLFTNYRNGYEPRPFDILDEDSFSWGVRSLFNYDFSIGSIPVKSSVGLEYFNEDYQVQLFENLYEQNNGGGTLEGSRFSNINQDRSYLNLFGQLNIQLTERLKAELGLSYNTTRYTLDNDTEQEAVDISGDYRYDTQYSPRVGVTYEAFANKFIYATVSRGFSVPSVAETLTPEGAINTDIKPETGINYEVGIKSSWLNQKLYAELALYTIQVDNLLVAERVAEDQYVGVNAGKTDHTGLELALNYDIPVKNGWTLTPYGSLAINDYSFDEFVDEDSDYSGNELTGVPEQVLNAGLDIKSDIGFRFSANYRYVGTIPLNDENSLYSEDYNLVNARSDYSFTLFRNLLTTVYAGVNNIFDKNYAAQILPNATGFGGAAPRYYYPGTPVNFYGGVQLKYQL